MQSWNNKIKRIYQTFSSILPIINFSNEMQIVKHSQLVI